MTRDPQTHNNTGIFNLIGTLISMYWKSVQEKFEGEKRTEPDTLKIERKSTQSNDRFHTLEISAPVLPQFLPLVSLLKRNSVNKNSSHQTTP